MSLTARQHRLLTFIAGRLRATGVCPSIADMMKALGLRSAGNVHATIGQLEDRGYVRRAHPRRARSLEVLRLTDDVSEGWLRAASTGAMVRELIRRGIGADTRSGHDRPDRLASDTPPDRRSRHGPGRTDGQAP